MSTPASTVWVSGKDGAVWINTAHVVSITERYVTVAGTGEKVRHLRINTTNGGTIAVEDERSTDEIVAALTGWEGEA